ncbi:MAG: selenide, water dikinase SelD, partial [Pseudomonadales bacterium]|nr:selenide, water dikinase SelD [Pseudomonadales bacterium]
ILYDALAELGLGDQPEDAAIERKPADHVTLHSVDGFRSFIDDPRLFAEITVQHALSDIYAMGGRPVSALAMVTLPFGAEDKNRALLVQLLSGVLSVLKEKDIRLAGGHTTEGAELGLGVAVNGLAREEALLWKAGLKPGDCLILTKPLGTGALLAADMQYRAKGTWMESAISIMRQSNAEAVACLHQYGVRACTDVTGFGFAGHLMEMLKASGVQAVIRLDDLPAMDGALEVINRWRIRSTLHDQNRRSIVGLQQRPHENVELLFDPQTSGGLLASIPADQAERCRQALIQAGYDRAALVGEVRPGAPAIHLEG